MEEQKNVKKVSEWKLIRNILIVFCVVFFLFGTGEQDVSGGVEPRYFTELCRIQGEDYYLTEETFLRRLHWYELRKDDEQDTLVHRFPLGIWPSWSEKLQSFYYTKRGNLYQWDVNSNQKSVLGVVGEYTQRSIQKGWMFWRDLDHHAWMRNLETGQTTWISDATGYHSCMVTDHHVVYNMGRASLLVVPLGSPRVLYSYELPYVEIQMQDTLDDAVLLTARDQGREYLFLLDAGNGSLYHVNKQDDNFADGYEISQALFAFGDVVYAREEQYRGETVATAICRVTATGEPVMSWQLPSEQTFKTMASGDDYLISVTESSVSELKTWERVLTYYQMTQLGETIPCYEWQPVLYHPLNTCHVICDGDQVISGCPSEENRVRFVVEKTSQELEILQCTWEQMSDTEKSEVVGSWQDGTVAVFPVPADDSRYHVESGVEGKELLLVTFESEKKDFLGNLEYIIEKDSGQIVGYSFRS